MYLAQLAPQDALGHILAHNLPDARGHKALAKGHRLAAADLALLRDLDLPQVLVAVLEPGDIPENEAARRLAAAACAPSVVAGGAAAGRVNLLAEAAGVVQIDQEALLRINLLDGLTIATRPAYSPTAARKRVATVKIIPFAVPEGRLAEAERIARAAGGVVGVRPLRPLAVGVVLVGSLAARQRIEGGVAPAVAGRINDAGAQLLATRYVAPGPEHIAEAVLALRGAGAELLIIAGETSVMDQDDVAPCGVRRAGGQVEHYGAPVEPGNLLLLAYLDDARGSMPIIGAPGCVRSRDLNIVDLILPRLLSGERLSRRDIALLGHGGLLA
ncbi:MAG TPA: molybdopterin-binding protein [Roseiflexaceae bacterium]|nr:molybdopterin-binding protein [Roseiflexaceae bacterium]